MNDKIQSMIEAARKALPLAYAPYSKFHVGCCIESEDGELFTGVNVENGSYSLTLCAESSAISQMIASGQKKIKSVVLLTKDNKLCPPCGACRQQIFEFSKPETPIYLCSQHEILKTTTIAELLPMAFSLNEHPGT